MENLQTATQDIEIGRNTTTKVDLLRRARDAMQAGEQSLHDAVEALALAKEDHRATQREMAEAIGKSASWVNKLLKWHRSGYNDHSPFGPTTKRGRVEHAQQRTKASKPRKSRNAIEERQTNADNPRTTPDNGEVENASLPPETETDAENTTSAGPQISGSRKPSPAQAKQKLKYAIDHWWPYLDEAGKSEITAHFLTKPGVRVS